jgi:hypothetical protein
MFGVPKHSELEPDYSLAEGDGNAPHDRGLGSVGLIIGHFHGTNVYAKVDWNYQFVTNDKAFLLYVAERGWENNGSTNGLGAKKPASPTNYRKELRREN